MQNPRDKSGYFSEETIAAIASAVGGAISVVRVSGSKAFQVLEQLTQSAQSSMSEPRKLFRSPLYSGKGEQLDDALWVRFVRPQSYTGEDVVEFHIHGGTFIAHRLMDTLAQFGVRQALPGEFSFRAVRNGKLSLLQAQAVADLIAASNDGAVSLALEKMSGTQNLLLENLATGLRRMAVLGEVGIDFADQDIDEVALPRLQTQVTPLISTLENLCQSFDRGIRLQDGVKVSFVGLPNAGKSSFFNALLGEDRSIVSDIAGTTRDLVRERLTLKGKQSTITLRLEDTAGLRAADNLVEKIGIDRARNSTREADLILFIVDPLSTFEQVQEQWDLLVKDSSKPIGSRTIGILTKSDQVDSETTQTILSRVRGLGISQWVITSALTGVGITDAVDQIVEYCEQMTYRNPGEVLLTRMDHLAAAREAIEHLLRAQQAPEIDLFASDIRQALHSLGPLIGETPPDDILGKIFSDFCIGK
jgi:tRNA modification GTPase